ncbi:MarR family winged helix-turn-helix transcriptional regulator [Rhodococcus sp. NPDC004095]
MVSPESASNLIESMRGLVRQARTVAARGSHRGMLPPPLGALLAHIACAEGNRPSMLAEDLRVTQSALSRQIAHAESLGYVVRTPDPLDGRASLLTLSEEGANALQVHREVMLEWARSAMADWTDEEVDDLTARLERLRGAVGSVPSPVTGAH